MTDSTDPGRTGDGFDDPTAPTWTSPEPAPPDPADPHRLTGGPAVAVRPPPQAAPTPRPLRAGAVRQTPYGQGPYGAEPATARTRPGRASTRSSRTTRSAYGQAPYGQQPYGSTAYGQPPYSLPPAPYGAPPAKNGSAIVLTDRLGRSAPVACCSLLALPVAHPRASWR